MAPDFSRYNPGPALAAALQRIGQRAVEPSTVPRAAQVGAVVCLPFFVVAAMAAAEALNEIARGIIPEGFVAGDAVLFLIGTVLLVATCMISFFWVKSGGFGLFGR